MGTFTHSHLLFGELLVRQRSSIMGYVPIFHNYVDSKIHAIVERKV